MTHDKAGPQPSAIPPPDRSQLERLNALYRIIDQAPAGGGLRARLASSARRLLGRILSRQQEFNAALVDHINRNMALGLEAHHSSVNTIEWMAGTIDGYRDARDEVERHLEALLARERRNDTAVRALAAQHEELRSALNVVQQAAHSLKRELAQLSAANPKTQIPSPHFQDSRSESRIPGPGSQFADEDSHKYVGFEDQFRGTPEAIRERLVPYADLFGGASNVLDIGCGRGEFLALLAERGIGAQGIDINESMVEVCRQKGLTAARADALDFLRAQPAGSLGGLLAAQVVEHVDPAYLTALLDAAWTALKPGSVIVLETINPACWFAFFESYIRDITHVRPLHPDTLKYLLLASGFQDVDVRFRSPYPEHDKLQKLPGAGLDDPTDVFNANVEKINRLLFTYLDYAAVARRA